ncbi:hypothetical protein [Sphingomonas taxi]|uniref:hypothetical protein n=1 Tax=Sphingomonas taxi TaxID=1549858 RepID=UPI0012E05531|nr:hypothetical protein [Sphingomonas taxi]
MSAPVLIAVLLACVFGLIVILRFKSRSEYRDNARHHAAALALEIERGQPAVAAFERDIRTEWPIFHCTAPNWRNRRYLLMNSDEGRIGLMWARWRDDLEVEWDAVIELKAVVSVELQQNETTIMKLETTGTTKKAGALSRAAIGGLLFGGAGAIVGAASAGSRIEATTTSTSQTLKGTPYLVIGTTDMMTPIHKVSMNSRSDGEKWLHRIRGALSALASQGV